MHLPDENIHEIPKGFECEFYREAKERLFEVTLDGECFTVIVWDEKGWDSDSSDERYVEQVKFVYAFEITCVSDNLIGQHSATSSKFTSSQHFPYFDSSKSNCGNETYNLCESHFSGPPEEGDYGVVAPSPLFCRETKNKI
jgi:hypothetical protein